MTETELHIDNEIALLLDRLEAEGLCMSCVGYALMRYGVDLIADSMKDSGAALAAGERLIRSLREMSSVRH